MLSDPMTLADTRERHRRILSAPMPLLAGEVATYSRRRGLRFWVTTGLQFTGVALMVALFWTGLA